VLAVLVSHEKAGRPLLFANTEYGAWYTDALVAVARERLPTQGSGRTSAPDTGRLHLARERERKHRQKRKEEDTAAETHLLRAINAEYARLPKQTRQWFVDWNRIATRIIGAALQNENPATRRAAAKIQKSIKSPT
jgi:hypothetical protein